MVEVKIRDVNKKGRTFRNLGLVTGSIKRKSGEIVPISTVGFKLETYIKRNGLDGKISLAFDNEELNVKIYRVQRNTLTHEISNIDLIEV